MPNIRNKKNTISHPLYRNAFLLKRGEVIYTSIVHEGIRYRETTHLTWHSNNFQKAKRILELRWEHLNNPEVVKESYKLEELFEQFKEFKAKSVSAGAIKKYNQSWNNWIKYDYTTAEMDTLRNDIVNLIGKSELHPNTIVKNLQMLSAFFKHLIESKLIDDNPILTSILPKMKHKKPEQFSEFEINALINSFEHNSDMNLLLRLIANTGLRIAEAISLTADNFKDNWIVLEGKGSIERELPILPNSDLSDICDILSKRKKAFVWIATQRPHTFLKRACDKLQIENKGFHGIRKYFENKLIESGANIKATADILGHTLQIQSKHYKTQSKRQHLEDAMDVISKQNKRNLKGTV